MSMSTEEFGRYSPINSLELSAYEQEAGFRRWCLENKQDLENDDSYECFLEEERNNSGEG